MSAEQHRNAGLAPYLPDALTRWYAEADADAVHRISVHRGILVCVDASGFTALTRRLSESGREGPEVLTRLLNSFFDEMCAVVAEYDGDVLKFAGDAFWALVPDNLTQEPLWSDLLAALDRVNASDERLREAPLTIHGGAEAGSLTLASLGVPGTRLEVEPVCPLVTAVYAACDEAGANQISLGPKLAERWRLSTVGGLKPSAPEGKLSASDDIRATRLASSADRRLRCYVPGDVLTRLESAAAASEIQSEHREAVAMFALIEPVDIAASPKAQYEALNPCVQTLVREVHALGGNLARLDPFKHGHKALVLFGAPVVQEDYELRAIRCAEKAVASSGGGATVSIGLAKGPLFCGEVGAHHRREYTVMGEAVNLAARLMAAASPGQAIFDQKLRNTLPEQVIGGEIRLKLKGVGDDVVSYRLLDISDSGGERRLTASTELVGRETDLAQLRAAAAAAGDGIGQCLAVAGPAGVGKSALLAALMASCRDWNQVSVACRPAVLYEPGWVARRLLTQAAEGSGLARADVELAASRVLGDRWRPIWASFLGDTVDDNDWTSSLDGELRLAKARELFGQLASEAWPSRFMIWLDDFDRADQYSRALMSGLAAYLQSRSWLVVCSGRNAQALVVTHGSDAPSTVLNLGNPATDAWTAHFKKTFAGGQREQTLLNDLLSKSGGNPGFIESFLQSCRQTGALVKNPVSHLWEVPLAGSTIGVPSSLAEAQLAVLDRLPESLRELLKRASAALGSFDAELIYDPAVGRETTAHLSDRASSEGYLLAAEDGSLRFADAALSEAAYQCLPQAQSRQLHQLYAERLSARQGTAPALLAKHYQLAGQASAAFNHALRAARSAMNFHALGEAADNFQICRDAVLRDSVGIPIPDRLEYLRLQTTFRRLEGEFPGAYRSARDWRHLAQQNGLFPVCLEAAIESAHLMWDQARYERCLAFLKKCSDGLDSTDLIDLRVRSLTLRGEIARRQGDFEAAQTKAEAAMALTEQGAAPDVRWETLNRLGLAYWGGGRLDDAAECYRRCRKDSRVSQDRYRGAKAANNLAIIEWEQGQFVEAQRLLEQAVEVFGQVGDRRNQAYASGNLASLYRISGRLTEAARIFHQGDLIFEQLGDRHAHMYTVGNLGDLDVIWGDLDKGLAAYEAAAEFASEVGDKELLAECLGRQGEVAFFREEYERSALKYGEAIEMAREIGSSEYLLRALIGRCRLDIRLREADKAAATVESIKAEAASSGAILAAREAVFLAAELNRILGDEERALQDLSEVLEYARIQAVFELGVKAAARTMSLDRGNSAAREALQEFATRFAAHNGPEAWNRLLSSPYLSYFVDVLGAVVPSEHSGHPYTQ